MHYLYILYSERVDQYYSGHSKNVDNRFEKHNNGHSASTKKGIPWKLKKVVCFKTKRDAIKAEKWLKRMKSRRVIEQVMAGEIDLKEVIER